jgi:hypothetical protein
MPRKKSTEDVAGRELDAVKADTVNVEQSCVRSVQGKKVQMRQVCAVAVDGEKLEMDQSASASAHAGEVRMNQSAALMCTSGKASIALSTSAVTVSGGQASVEKSLLGVVAAKDISVRDSRSVFLLANRVEGNLTTLLDTRTALAFGAVAGGIIGLISLFRRR